MMRREKPSAIIMAVSTKTLRIFPPIVVINFCFNNNMDNNHSLVILRNSVWIQCAGMFITYLFKITAELFESYVLLMINEKGIIYKGNQYYINVK